MKAGWKECLLKDLLVLHDAKRIPLSSRQRAERKGPYPYHGATGVVDYVDDYLFDGDYILLGEDGSVITENNKPVLQFVRGKIWVNNHAHVITASKNVDFRFLYYALADLNIRPAVTGAVQLKVSQGNLLSLKTTIPQLPVQRRIAAVLGALDDKIELNRKMCKNLEEQAQALFKSWFVDFEPWGGKMPKKWKMGTLGEITSRMGTGLNPRRNFLLGHGTNYYVTIKNMGDNRIYLNDKCDKIDDEAIALINKRSDLRAGDVLFSGIGTIGRTYLISRTPKNWNTSESVFNLRPAGGISSEYLYLLMLSDALQGYVQEYAQGSAQKGIRMADLKRYQCVMPDEKGINNFTAIVKPIIDQVTRNNEESDLLAETRDALLPKLMSGEIEV